MKEIFFKYINITTFLQYFFRDLVRLFPEAKVILTVRDQENGMNR